MRKSFKKAVVVLALIFFLMQFNFFIHAQTTGFATTGTVTNTNPNAITVHNTLYIGRGLTAMSNNTVIGVNAYVNATSGYNSSTIIGSGAMQYSTTADNTVAIGFNALGGIATTNLNTGTQNIAIGNEALRRNTSGNYNTAIGWGAMQNSTTGSSNVAQGQTSLSANTTGSQNCAFGRQALVSLNSTTDASSNTAIGYQALQYLTTGSNNVGIGYNAGSANFTNGSNNVFIGAGTVSNSGNNQLNIQNCIYGIGMGQAGAGSGSVGLGISSPLSRLHLGSGMIRIDGTVTTANMNVNYFNGGPGTGLQLQDGSDFFGILLENKAPGGLDDHDVVMYYGDNLGGEDLKFCRANWNTPTAGVHNILEVMRLSANGNLGIATAAPTARLHVFGPIGGTNSTVRFENLPVNTQGNLPVIVIDANGNLFRANNTVGNRPASASNSELVDKLDKLELENENFKTQIEELRNKLNLLTPGDVTIKINSIEVVPNPITGTSVVSYKLDNTNTAAYLIISDLQGKLLKQISLTKNQASGQVQVSKKDLPNGMYVFAIVSGNAEVQSKKVLVAE